MSAASHGKLQSHICQAFQPSWEIHRQTFRASEVATGCLSGFRDVGIMAKLHYMEGQEISESWLVTPETHIGTLVIPVINLLFQSL